MKITLDMIRTDLPPIIHYKDGSVNMVLAVWKKDNYCETNQCIPRWQICNTEYYNTHPNEYDGWIELENIL